MTFAAFLFRYRFMDKLKPLQFCFSVFVTGKAQRPLTIDEQKPTVGAVTGMALVALAVRNRLMRRLRDFVFLMAFAAQVCNRFPGQKELAITGMRVVT